MTYMHFDVFPADSLGWLCRALNTRDNVCIHLFTFPGNHLRRCTPAAPPYAALQGRLPITTELGWQEEGEGAEKDETER